MRCERAGELMSLRLDDELPPAEGALLDAHLEGCAACHRTWEAMQRLSTLFARAPSVSPPEDFTNRVMSRLAERHARAAPVWGALVLLLGAGTLTLLVALPLLGAAGVLVEMVGQPNLVRHSMEFLPGFFSIGLALLRASWLFLSSLFRLVSPPLVALYLGLVVMLTAGWLLVLRIVRPSSRVVHVG